MWIFKKRTKNIVTSSCAICYIGLGIRSHNFVTWIWNTVLSRYNSFPRYGQPVFGMLFVIPSCTIRSARIAIHPFAPNLMEGFRYLENVLFKSMERSTIQNHEFYKIRDRLTNPWERIINRWARISNPSERILNPREQMSLVTVGVAS